MVCSCMSLTFGILVLLCPFGLSSRPVFLLATGAIYMLSRGRVKLFATEENVAKQEEEEEEEEGEKEEESEIELRVRDFFFFLFVFTQGALN